MKFLQQKIKDPKVQVSLILLVLFIATFTHLPFNLSLNLLLYCVGFTLASDLLFTFIRRRGFFLPHAAMVTGMIFALIIDPSASWLQILTIAASAMAIKNFLRFSGRHIFNPAASGLVTGYLLFSLNPSWWGPSFFNANLLSVKNIFILSAILALFYVSAIRMRRLPAIVAFLLLFSLAFGLTTGSLTITSFLRTFINPGTLFYATLMLPEPMTSPIRIERQIMYAGFIALVNTLFASGIVSRFLENINFPDTSLLALLLGNLLFFKFR